MKAIFGSDITLLRGRMGLDHRQFALLNGVHHTTACRWEAKATEEVKLDPLHLLILRHALRRFSALSIEKSRELANRIMAAVNRSGTLAGLAVLVDDLPKVAVTQLEPEVLQPEKLT